MTMDSKVVSQVVDYSNLTDGWAIFEYSIYKLEQTRTRNFVKNQFYSLGLKEIQL